MNFWAAAPRLKRRRDRARRWAAGVGEFPRRAPFPIVSGVMTGLSSRSSFPTMRRRAVIVAALFFTAVATAFAAGSSPAKSFVDRPHDFISNTISGTVGWFDRFFSPAHEEIESNQSFVRVIGNYGWSNGDGFRFRPRVRLRVRVPALRRRLSLIVSGEDRRETDVQPVDKPAPQEIVVPPTPGTENNSQVAVQYTALQYLRSRIDVDAGFRAQLEAAVDARFRQLIPISRSARARFTETGFWRENSGFGQRLQFTAEQTVSPAAYLSWQNAGTTYAKRVGMDWDSALFLETRLASASAINFGGQCFGATHPAAIVSLYRLSSRYRQNVWRPWFFYEVEPGVDFRRSAPGWETVPNLVFRVEVMFRKDS
jgi:hypothetical protein